MRRGHLPTIWEKSLGVCPETGAAESNLEVVAQHVFAAGASFPSSPHRQLGKQLRHRRVGQHLPVTTRRLLGLLAKLHEFPCEVDGGYPAGPGRRLRASGQRRQQL